MYSSINTGSNCLGIEFHQKFTKSGTYDNWDAIAVVVGGLIVYASHIL